MQRKIIPLIIIALTFVNLFAPFSVGVNSNGNTVVNKNVAEAAQSQVTITPAYATENAILLSFWIKRAETDDHGFFYVVTINPGTKLKSFVDISNSNLTEKDVFDTSASTYFIGAAIPNKNLTNCSKEYKNGSDTICEVLIPAKIEGLKADTKYYVSSWIYNGNINDIRSNGAVLDQLVKTAPVGKTVTQTTPGAVITTTGDVAAAKAKADQACTDEANNPSDTTLHQKCIDATDAYNAAKKASLAAGDSDNLPACWQGITQGFSIAGCTSQLIYYILFVPTSFLFGLTGKFFDATFGYSVQSSSYKSPFVLQGWGLVRDFVNIFFIFVLLYIAFATILQVKIGGHNPKGMIVNVVIIGLMMNFSLFAAQLIIDSSNILARVFYNSNVIKINDNSGNPSTQTGNLKLSEAIVSKVNPQALISADAASKIQVIDKKSSDVPKTGGVSASTFIVITLLATAVNIVGMIVFLSVGLIFVARVIGLWIYMIFAPLAFFSYTVPSMQSFQMVGWKKWWPELLSMSFLAPIFIFFMYLIIKFLDVGLGLVGTYATKTGLDFVIGIIIPFAFIMILMMKAKDIAKKMSGSLGQSITGGVAAVGGLALGGAALTTAFAGRKIIGGGIAKASRSKDAIHYGEQKIAFNKKLDEWKTNGRKAGAPKPTWSDHKQQNNVKDGVFTRLGGNLNAKQMKVNEVDHARHEIDGVKEKAGLKGVDDMNLSGVDEKKMKDVYSKEKRSEAEAAIRREGYVDHNGNTTESEDQFKANNRNAYTTAALFDANNRQPNGELTDEAKKMVENRLQVAFNGVLKTTSDKKLSEDFTHLRDGSKQKVSAYDRAFSRSNKGSYDVRNLSQEKSDKREGVLTKLGVGAIAGIALGVRSGLKSTNVNHGTGQGDVIKDLGNTISEALKSVKINVKIEGGDHSSGKADPSHGGGH